MSDDNTHWLAEAESCRRLADKFARVAIEGGARLKTLHGDWWHRQLARVSNNVAWAVTVRRQQRRYEAYARGEQ